MNKNHDFLTTATGTILPLVLVQILNHYGIAHVTLADLANKLPELITVAVLGLLSNNNKT